VIAVIAILELPVIEIIDAGCGIARIDLLRPRQIQLELVRLGLGAGLRARASRSIRDLAARMPGTSRDGAAIQPDQIAQLVQLLLVELARIADAQIVERQVCKRHALELVDLKAERLEHPVDLAVLALVDGHRDPRVLALPGEELHRRRHRRRAVVELHALAELLQVILREPAVDLDVVRLRDVARRREQSRGELAIVGQQQHALRVEVEAADRLDRHR
jgi:hypothetical protein